MFSFTILPILFANINIQIYAEPIKTNNFFIFLFFFQFDNMVDQQNYLFHQFHFY
jgi:hypothetical protein